MPEREPGPEAAIEHAKRYPYEQPRSSYVGTPDGPLPLPGDQAHWDPATAPVGGPDGRGRSFAEVCAGLGLPPGYEAEPRTPVLGYGSNPAPETLIRKFASAGPFAIPVVAVRVHDLDAVYSAHVHRGYVPATLQHSLGTRLPAFLIYLTATELELMNASESLGINYLLAEVGGTVEFADGEALASFTTYLSTRGCLTEGASCVAVSGISAEGRSFPARAEPEVLAAIHRSLGGERTLDEFIAACVAPDGLAAEVTKRLAAEATPFARRAWVPLDG